MEYMTTPDGRDSLQHRAEMTNEYGARAFDMIRSSWVCTRCSGEVGAPPALIVPYANYRSLAQATESVAKVAESGDLTQPGSASPCARCGGPGRLAFADLYFFCSAPAINTDLVARYAQGAPPQLFRWSLQTGATPFAPPPDIDRAVARDAIIRTLAAHREGEDAGAGMALLREAISVVPGEPELLKFMPWVHRVGDFELSSAISAAYLRACPNEAAGHYWAAQVIVELVGAGQAPKSRIDEAVPMLERAIQLQNDYPDAQIGLANVSRIRGRDDEAERALRGLIANHPNHPEGNYTLGLVLLPKNPAEALACFERGERESPSDADYPRSRARALIALNRMDEARAAIQRARQLAPNDPRIDQVASQITTGAQRTITWIIRGIIAAVLIGVLVTVVVVAKGAISGKPAAGSLKPGLKHPKH